MTPEPIEHITIEQRFCGPPASGNGGYVCGRLGAYINGCAKVRLSIPPPLGVPLAVYRTEDGAALKDGDRKVAQAWPSQFNLAIPEAPSMTEAGTMAERYVGLHDHAFSTCFVCGPDRAVGDGLRIFPGFSHSLAMVASPWTPDASLADAAGRIHPWFIWSALDCPSGWAFMHKNQGPAVLGEFCVRIDEVIEVNQPMVVIGWELQHKGRKHHTASALFHDDGRLVACATALWFEIDLAHLEGTAA